jgi:pentatricopeptide repeat protein
VTFNSLIDAAIRCRDLPAATKLLEQMKKAGITPDLITYSTLVTGFCDQGEMDVALTLLEHLKQQGMRCDEILFNSLLEGCVKSNQAERGLELFQEMVAEKVQPSNITFSILVKVYASAGRLDAALEIVKRMEPEFKVKPSNIVFTCLVKCYVAAQRLPQAANLLLGLPKAAKIQPEQPMYVLVLPALIAQKHLDLACDVFEALCKAPLGNADSRSAPSLSALAHQLFDAVSRSSLMQKEKARRLLTGVIRQTPGLAEHEAALEAHLGPKTAGWGGQEFVPGATEFAMPWDPLAADALAMQHLNQAAYYQAWWQQQWGMGGDYGATFEHPATPQRVVGSADENASPNVMDILMTQDMGSSEKAPRSRRRTQRPTGTPKTPVKMAPVVVSTSPAGLSSPWEAAKLERVSPMPDQLASPSK